MFFLLPILLTLPGHAAPPTVADLERNTLPTELQDWLPYLSQKHPEWACVATDNCQWPGLFNLSATAEGGHFSFGLRMDRAGEIALPGGRGAWPQQLQLRSYAGEAARPALVLLDRDGVPTLSLPAGVYLIEGTYLWNAMPQGIPMPAPIGVVTLSVNGEQISEPRIDAGILRLGTGDAPGESRLELDVVRKIRDGVPAVIETQLLLRASGSAREISLGHVLLEQSHPVQLTSELPARLSPEGDLILQVRPGTWTLTLDATYEGALSQLSAPTLQAPWPEVEYWAVQSDDSVRALTLSGPVGVDPARTPMPSAWRGMPTFRLNPGDILKFEELRRGQPEAPANELTLGREFWLDQSGEGFTVRDVFSGTMNRDWRLDLLAPGSLGHASLNDEDLVITEGKTGNTGIEVRSNNCGLVAESRLDEDGSFSAVGWDTSVKSLGVSLHLPMGWSLVAALGADSAPGALWAQWSVGDGLAVALIALGLGRWLGVGWGLAVLLALLSGWQQVNMPTWSWLPALLSLYIPPNRWSHWLRGLGLLPLSLALCYFVLNDVRTGIFPQLSQTSSIDLVSTITEQEMSFGSDITNSDVPRGWQAQTIETKKESYKNPRSLSLQNDPGAVAQTGPGLPRWQGQIYNLYWTGTVGADQKLRLILLSPGMNMFFSLLRGIILSALFYRLWKQIPRPITDTALLFCGIFLLSPTEAQAAPPAEVLSQLEEQLGSPACTENCVSVPSARLMINENTLIVSAEVHTAVASSWPLPGPTEAWVPAHVNVDGLPALALARQADGFLHLRLDPGVHQVLVTGPLPADAAIALQFALAPKFLEVQAQDWSVEGVRADGSLEGALQLQRRAGGGSVASLSPWVEVHRYLDLGVPWKVRTEVKRVGPSDQPLSLKIPLLQGEAVTDDGFMVNEGMVSVALGRDMESISWISTLEMSEQLALTAPTEQPWTEVWEVSCSPVYACSYAGPPPLVHVQDDTWTPLWRPWPGESLTLSVSRPEAAPGQVLTIDQADLRWTFGPRSLSGTLNLNVRASQGGKLPIHLPEGAVLTKVTLANKVTPMRAKDQQLDLPLRPGAQQIVLEFSVPQSFSFWSQLPEFQLSSPVVNASTRLQGLSGRIPLWFSTANQGPVVGFWGRILLIVGLSLFAHRAIGGPKRWEWVIFGLLFNQLSFFFFIIPITTLFLIYLLQRTHPLWTRRFLLAATALGALISLGLLYSSLYDGLLGEPDIAIMGSESTRYAQHWFLDRSEGALPAPTLISVPLWIWRLGQLALVLLLLSALPRSGAALRRLRWLN